LTIDCLRLGSAAQEASTAQKLDLPFSALASVRQLSPWVQEPKPVPEGLVVINQEYVAKQPIHLKCVEGKGKRDAFTIADAATGVNNCLRCTIAQDALRSCTQDPPLSPASCW
jgi:hypothetical protein